MERPLVEGDVSLPLEQRGVEASKPLFAPLLSFARSVAPPLSALAVAVGTWEAWVRLRGVPEYLVPAPSAIAQRLAEDPAFFARQGGVTLYGALAGFTLGSTVAILLAVAMAHSRFLERSLFPLAIMVKVTPIVAIAPLLAVWFGFGLAPKLFIIALIVFFPVMVNAVIGLRSVNPWALQYLQSLAASPWEVLLKLRLPSALPYLFAAFKVSVPLSVIGAVVAEWFSGEEGLGRVIQVSNSNVDMPTAFAAIVSLAALGVTLYLGVSLVERRLLSWHESAIDT
ncbi:MAG TPA: ABC transporter permease [Dehalococcoidia bacterium]|nr:ABC transporter permease [Dehalococcoidia bacterium]